MTEKLTTYVLTDQWDAANRYAAAASVDVMIENPSRTSGLYWTITDSTATPGSDPQDDTAPIAYGDYRTVTLAAGEYLWLAGDVGTVRF